MKKQSHQLKRVTALTRHNKTFYYIDGKRVSKEYYDQIDYAGLDSCLQAFVDGDKVTQLKTVTVV